MASESIRKSDDQLPGAFKTLVFVGGGVAVLVVLGFSLFIGHARVDEIDGHLFAHYGRQILEGATLYVDVWDNKPPGIFWINALGLWLGGGDIKGVWLLQGIAMIGAAVLLFVIFRRMYGSVQATTCTVLCVIFLNIHNYHVGANRPSTYFVLTELAFFYFYLGAAVGRDRCVTVCLLAGACGAIGFAFKQSALAVTGAALIHTIYLLIRSDIDRRVAVSRISSIFAGWVSVMLIIMAALWVTSDLRAAWDAVVGFNRRYFLPGAGSSFAPPFIWIEEHLQNMGLALVLAAATLFLPAVVYVARARKSSDPAIIAPTSESLPKGYVFFQWAWLLIAIYLAALGPHMRVAYLAIALPPLVMAMAHSVHLLVASPRVGGQVAPHYVLVGLLWFGFMLVWPLHAQWGMAMRQYYHRYVAPTDPQLEERLAVIDEMANGDETFFAFGYAVEWYWKSGRPNAIKYIGTEKIAQLGLHGQPLLDEVVERLKASPPKLIFLDGPSIDKSASVGHLRTKQLADWLASAYEPLANASIQNVLVRRDR